MNDAGGIGLIASPLGAFQQPEDEEFVFLIEYEGWANGFDVIFYAVLMALAATLLWVAYRTMDHPRLPVIRSDDAPPRANLAGVARYVLATPVLVLFWLTVLFLLIATVSGERSASAILVAASGVVGGARLLAHIKPEISHELAKTVPVVILGLIIIGNGFAGLDRFVAAIEELPENLYVAYAIGLVGWDYLLTSIWFIAIRARWRGRQRRTDRGGSGEGLVTRMWNRFNQIGYGLVGSGAGAGAGDAAGDAARADTEDSEREPPKEVAGTSDTSPQPGAQPDVTSRGSTD